jgi:hypothetical protein
MSGLRLKSDRMGRCNSRPSHMEERMAKKGLWSNINAKRERIKEGSGEKMRKPGAKGAPTAKALSESKKK